MKFTEKLDAAVRKNNSLLCIGLDIDLKKIPSSLLNKGDTIFDFNKAIIDATKDLVCAYKPNIAFYEMYGIYGMQALIKTIEYASDDIPIILDAKRGDVGHTASAYAKAIFEIYKADATTINPYMGFDSIEPFIEYKDKGIFILCLTSNPGHKDFQVLGKEEPLYRTVAKNVKKWDVSENCGLVVGATDRVTFTIELGMRAAFSVVGAVEHEGNATEQAVGRGHGEHPGGTGDGRSAGSWDDWNGLVGLLEHGGSPWASQSGRSSVQERKSYSLTW